MLFRSKKVAVGRPTAFYLPAWEEEDYAIAQANEPLEADGRFANDRVQVTLQGEFSARPRESVQFWAPEIPMAGVAEVWSGLHEEAAGVARELGGSIGQGHGERWPCDRWRQTERSVSRTSGDPEHRAS